MITAFIVLMNMAFAAAPADGTYLRFCYTIGEDTLQSSLQIQNGKWIQTHTAFEEDSCKAPYLIYQTEYNATVVDANVDLAMAEASYTPLSDEVRDALNMIAYCGFTNWKTNQKKVVTGLLCDEFQVAKVSEVLYSIFKRELSTDQHESLYLGISTHSEDGKSALTRYQGTEQTPYLKLQP